MMASHVLNFHEINFAWQTIDLKVCGGRLGSLTLRLRLFYSPSEILVYAVKISGDLR